MPIVGSSAYVSVETITLLIRALANDMIYSQSGEILTDTANFMFPLLNDALEWFQAEVNNHGVETFIKETVLTPVTAIPLVNPQLQVNVSDTGYFDSVNNFATPQVPPDLQFPLFMWEAQTGSTENWVPMQECPDGLPSWVQTQRLRLWEWRQDALYMPGSVQSNDLRLRYRGTQAAFVTTSDTLYFRNATGPIAYKMLAAYYASRNPEAAAVADSEAMKRVSQIFTANSRMKQRETITPISYGSPMGRQRFYPPRNS